MSKKSSRDRQQDEGSPAKYNIDGLRNLTTNPTKEESAAQTTDGRRSFCFSSRCPLDVYGLALRYRHTLGSIVVGTRWECCMKYV
jgi:hypothetical protein